MGPQFSQILAYHGNTVIAMGPLGQDDPPTSTLDYVEEIHAWIYQEESVTSHAVAMPLMPGGTPLPLTGMPVLQEPGVCWMLPLTTISEATTPEFHPGRAFAVAIAMFSNDPNSPQQPRDIGQKKGHVIWWGHPVQLLESEQAVLLATGPAYKGNPAEAFEEITTLLQGPSVRPQAS
jgi:hypothetical protein